MALGFNYTLSVNESASLKNLEDFTKKIGDKTIKIGIDFDMDSFDTMIGKIQDKLDGITDKLRLEFGEFDVDVDALQKQLKKVGDKVKLSIPAEIEVREKEVDKALGSAGDGLGDKVQHRIQNLQDSLTIALNNLAKKVNENGLQGFIPIEDIRRSIAELDRMDGGLKAVNQYAKDIRQEIQSWNQVTTAQNELFKTTATKASDVADEVTKINKAASDKALKEQIKYLQQNIDSQVENIRYSKEFSKLTSQQKQDFENLAKSVQLSGNSLKEVKHNYAEINYELKEFKSNNIEPIIKKQESAFEKLFGTVSAGTLIYQGIQEAIQLTKQVMHDAVDYAYELDEAYTNINKTMDITSDDFDGMVDNATKIANANGVTTNSVLDMMKVYANAGTTIEQINAKMEMATAFQNVTGQSAEEVTNSIQAIMNQFKLAQDTAYEAADSMEYLGNVMVGVGYNLAKDEGLAMQDIIAGVERAGAVIQNSGGSFEWLAAIVGTLSEQMNATGEETANAMKMISARTLQSKEAIEELAAAGEDMSEIDVQASNAEKALADIGISVRDQFGAFRDLEDILTDVASKWDTLNNTQQQLVSEKLAGNNRRNYFIALMEDYERVIELQDIAANSNGALLEASNKQAESLAGVTNQFKNSLNELYQGVIDSDGLKNVIVMGDGLIQVLVKITDNFDKLIPVIGGATAAWIAYDIATKGAADSMVGKLMGGITGTIGKLKTLITSLGAAKIAAIGLAGIIGGVAIAAIQKYNQMAEEKREHLLGISDAMSAYEESAKNIQNIDEQINDYAELNEKLQDANISLEEQQQYEAELQSIRESLATDERFKSILEDETKSIEAQVNAMKGLNEYEGRKGARDLLNETSLSGSDIREFTGGLNYSAGEYERINAELDDMYTKLAEIRQQQQAKNLSEQDYLALQNQETELLDKIKAKQDDMFFEEDTIIQAYEALMAYQEAGKIANEFGIESGREQLDILETMKPIYDKIVGVKEDAVDATQEELELEQQLTDEKIAQAGITTESNDSELAKTVKAQEELNQRYMDSLNYLQEAKDLINSLADGLSIDEMNTILDSDLMNDFTGAIDNATDVTEHLKGKMQEMQDIAYETYGNMMLADDEYWTSAMRKCAEALGVNSIEFIDYINEKGLARKVDVTNAKNATDAENQMNVSLCKQLMQGYAGVVNSKAGNRKTDMNNVANFLNTQEAKEAQTIDELKTAWAAYYNAKVKAVQREYLDLKYSIKDMDAGQVDPAVYKQLQDLNNSIQNWYQTNKDVTNYFESISTSFGGVSGALNQAAAAAGAAIGSAGSGSGGSSSKPSSSGGSGGSSTQREVEDMESLVDRYYQLNDAINKVTKALDKNREKQETVKTKSEYTKLINEEIKLINDEVKALKKLQKEQQKERNEIKATLSSNGFKFDKDGNITNYADRLKKLTDYANSITDPDKKESVQKQVQAIADLIERYTELEDTVLPETSLEIENLKNEIEEINKEFEENTKLIEQLGDRYFDVMSKIADVDNALAKNEQAQGTATGQEKLDLMKEEIDLLKQKQQLLQDQKSQAQSEAKSLQDQLKAEGVKFDKNGNVSNYEQLTKKLTDDANKLVGDEREEALQHAQDILDLIDQYMTLTDETIPGLEEAWQDYADEVENTEKEMLETVEDIQKQVTQAYEEEQTKRYNKLKENLKKEQEAMNEAYQEETYEKGLQSQQNQLDEIAQQIAIYSRDTSEAGKARLEQLKQQYADLQEQMNEDIREHENDLANERFDEEVESLDEELAEILSPENLVSVVNQAITSGMITVGDEVVRLDELMTNWMDESGDGLYALGGQLKSELVDNLQAAKTIMDEMGLSGFASLSKAFPGGGTTNNANTINFNKALVNVEGSMTTDIDTEALAEQLKNEVLKAINDAMK